jgi:hypothetical protein
LANHEPSINNPLRRHTFSLYTINNQCLSVQGLMIECPLFTVSESDCADTSYNKHILLLHDKGWHHFNH